MALQTIIHDDKALFNGYTKPDFITGEWYGNCQATIDDVSNLQTLTNNLFNWLKNDGWTAPVAGYMEGDVPPGLISDPNSLTYIENVPMYEYQSPNGGNNGAVTTLISAWYSDGFQGYRTGDYTCNIGDGPATSTVLTLTGVSVGGGNAVYSFSGFTGVAPTVGTTMKVSGFSNNNNNVTAVITAASVTGSTGTVTVVAQPGQVSQSFQSASAILANAFEMFLYSVTAHATGCQSPHYITTPNTSLGAHYWPWGYDPNYFPIHYAEPAYWTLYCGQGGVGSGLGATTCTTVGTTNELMPALRTYLGPSSLTPTTCSIGPANYTQPSAFCEGEGAYFILGLHSNR